MYDDTCGLVHTVLITLAMLVAIAAFLTGTSLLHTASSEGIAELSDGSTNYETTKEDDSFEKAIAEIERQQALEEEKKLQEQKAAESAAREAARVKRSEELHEAASKVGSYIHKGINVVGVLGVVASISCLTAFAVVCIMYIQKSLLYFTEGRKYKQFEAPAMNSLKHSLFSLAALCCFCALAFL